jgi:hypothetical protein
MKNRKENKLRKQLADEPEFKEDGSVNPYHGYTVEDHKRDKKASKKKEKKAVKKALKEAKGTGSPYDGYTWKDHKRDKKRAGTGNHPQNR